MKFITKKIRVAVLMIAILLSVIMPMEQVQAATNRTIITASAEVNMTEEENSSADAAEDTVSMTLEEALKQNGELENRYSRLEEKYQREKEFSRSVIYVLIFVIAILIVIIINLIVFNRNKADEDFEESFKEKKTVRKESAKREPVKKESEEKEPEEKETEEKENSVQEERTEEKVVAVLPKQEKSVPKKEKPAPKVEKSASKAEKTSDRVEVGNKFEVFDFNDED